MIGIRRLKGSARRRWTGLGAFLATIAIAFQCIVVQTHVDFAPHSDLIAGAAHSESVLTGALSGKAPAPCIICQELALAGAFLHASPPVIALVSHALSFAAPAPSIAATFSFPAHPWQSRAPPSFL
jgi:hypothetical protein